MSKSSLQAIEIPSSAIDLPRDGKKQTLFFYTLFVVSVLCHLAVIFTINSQGFKINLEEEEEWLIETEIDLAAEFETAAKISMKDTKKAVESKVNEKLLPQLPKDFKVEEQKLETKLEESELGELKPKEKEETKPVEKKQETAPKPIKQTFNENKSTNLIKKQDALKRMALDRLRKLEKTAVKTQSSEDINLSALQSKINNNKKLKMFSKSEKNSVKNKYIALVKIIIKRNYFLPDTFNYKKANLKVGILIIIDNNGNLVKLKIKKPSSDVAFDNLTLKAAKQSLPLPKPPKELVGREIMLMFTP